MSCTPRRANAEGFIKARLDRYVSRDIIERIWAAGILAAIEDKEVKR